MRKFVYSAEKYNQAKNLKNGNIYIASDYGYIGNAVKERKERLIKESLKPILEDVEICVNGESIRGVLNNSEESLFIKSGYETTAGGDCDSVSIPAHAILIQTSPGSPDEFERLKLLPASDAERIEGEPISQNVTVRILQRSSNFRFSEVGVLEYEGTLRQLKEIICYEGDYFCPRKIFGLQDEISFEDEIDVRRFLDFCKKRDIKITLANSKQVE